MRRGLAKMQGINLLMTDWKKDKDFYQPIKKMKLKKVKDMNMKMKVTAKENKVIQYWEQSNKALYLRVQSQKQWVQIDLKELAKYPMTSIPFSFGLPCHFLEKTDKSKLFHKACEGIDDSKVPPVNETICIYDGNANYHCMEDIPGNFKQIYRKIINSMSKTRDALFSTDMYKKNSIWSIEQRRGISEKLKIASATKKPQDWKTFLTNDQNKAAY